MPKHFNNLTPAELERLAMLAEEASEIAKAAMKIIRHGYSSHNPDGDRNTNNRTQLTRELTDLFAVYRLMTECYDLPMIPPVDVDIAVERKMRYAHHQQPLNRP